MEKRMVMLIGTVIVSERPSPRPSLENAVQGKIPCKRQSRMYVVELWGLKQPNILQNNKTVLICSTPERFTKSIDSPDVFKITRQHKCLINITLHALKRYVLIIGVDKCKETPITVKWRNHVPEHTGAVWCFEDVKSVEML